MFFGIVTFATTLALAAFFGQTAGPEWAIGKARFNGFNGMIGMPPLELPWFGGRIRSRATRSTTSSSALLLAIYLGLRVLVNSRFGNVLVAIREDPLRTELLGYDVRKYQLVAFVIGSSLAALSGVLYTAWGQFIPPASMGLPAAAMPIIWVAFSGRQDLTATLVGTFLLLLMFQTITVYSQQYALILMGFLLLRHGDAGAAGFVHGVGRFLGRSAGATRRDRRERERARRHDGHPRDPRAAQALRRPGGRRRTSTSRSTSRRDPLPDRPERRRQEHALQAGGRHLRAVGWRGAVPRRERHAAQALRAGRPGHEHQAAGAQRLPRAAGGRRTCEIALQRKSSGRRWNAEKERLLEFLQLQDDAAQAGRHPLARPAAVAGDRHGAGARTRSPAAGRTDGGHVARRRRSAPASMIKRLNAEGMTMLVVEHDMTFVRQIAQRVTVLHLGRVFAQGRIDAIIADPRVEEIYLGKSHGRLKPCSTSPACAPATAARRSCTAST